MALPASPPHHGDVLHRRLNAAGPARWALDGLLIAWCAAWIWVGVSVATELRGLARLSDTVGEVGRAVERTGAALSTLDELPLVGDRTREPAEAIQRAGESAIRSARENRQSVRTTSLLLGISLAAIPSVPVLLLYIPQRLLLARERRELRRALAHGGDPALETLLARRALLTLPYHRLRDVSDSPEADFEAGRHAGLAAAELSRLGLRPPRRPRRGAAA